VSGSASPKNAPKDSQLIIRINRSERDAFVALCHELDTSAAREVRQFIRGFLKDRGRHKAAPD